MTDAALPPVESAPFASASVPSARPQSGPWLVIRNPVAGRARNRRAWDDFARALRRRGLSFEVCTTSCAGDGARLAEAAVRAGVGRILVAGGDGSVHEVLNGMMRARGDGFSNDHAPTLVPLPLGTGNDWARSLRLPRNPDRLAALVAAARATPHDVGVIRFPGRDDQPQRWFVNVAGAGFDAHVISRLPPLTPSRLAYLAGALRELSRYRSPRFRIGVDGAAPREGSFLLAFVANGQYCGHRMHVAPPALLDDGLFDVVTIDDMGLLRALPKLVELYFGNVLRDPLVHHQTARRVRIESDPVTAVEADGQLVGTTPVEFSVERGALRVVRGP